MFKIYLSCDTNIEIPLSIANESGLIKNLIEDTNANSFVLPKDINLEESEIIRFFDHYTILLKDKGFKFEDLLLFLKVADYFAYDNITITITSSRTPPLPRTEAGKIQTPSKKTINLIDLLARRIAHKLVISDIKLLNLDLSRTRYANLPDTLKDYIQKAIHSSKVAKLSFMKETSDECLKKMLWSKYIYPRDPAKSIKIEDNGLLQVIKLNGLLTDDYPTKKLYIFQDCRSTPYNQNVHHINNIYILSDMKYSFVENPSQLSLWINVPVSNNYSQELVPIPEITINNGKKRIFNIKGWPGTAAAWFSYHQDTLSFNMVKVVNSKVVIEREREGLKDEIILDSPLWKLSATKYNTYVFGKTSILKGSLNEKYKSMVPWQLEDEDDDSFYSINRNYDLIIVIDILNNSEVFKMIIPSKELYCIDNRGKYLIFTSSSRKSIELYHIKKKVRLFRITFKEIFEDETQSNKSEFILDPFNKLIIVNTQLYPIAITFQGKITRHKSHGSLYNKILFVVKNGILTLDSNSFEASEETMEKGFTDKRKYGEVICLRDPLSFDISFRFNNLPISGYSSSLLRQKILVSPKGENFSLFHYNLYHFRLFPITKLEYRSLETILD